MSITDPLIGKKLGDYTIEGILGTGGMARVYRGYDDNLDRHAAIKVIEPQLIASAEEDEYRERFLREARAIARLNHPNIVSIYQFNQIGNIYYIAMEYAAGDNLRDILKGYIRQGRIMPTEQLLSILRDIGDALDYAHQQNIIHRDIKPSNIIVSEGGRAVLTDFGLALNAMEGTIGNTFGSVHYIAPEQAISSAQSVAQSDQYSLGIVAYELLTGRVPFDDASAMSVALKHISDPPPPPTELNPNIPAEVEQVLMRTLEKEPLDRFPSCKEFVSAIGLAFTMLENADIEAPRALTEAVGGPPETAAFPPGQVLVESEPDVPEASRPGVELQTEKQARRGNLFVMVAVLIIILLVAGYFLYNRIQEQNALATEMTEAAALEIAAGETAVQQAIDAAATGDSIATVDAGNTESALETAVESANLTATQAANDMATANAIATETSDAVIQAANDTATADAIATETSNVATMEAIAVLTESFDNTQTAIAEQVTPSNTARPTNTATDVPTNTPRPTLTATPAIFITDETDTRQLLLVYDGRSVIISNRDTVERLNLSEIRFVLFEPDEDGNLRQTDRFDMDGSNLEDRARNMIPERCLQLLDSDQYNTLPSPNPLANNVCTALPFWQSTPHTFWLSESEEAYFEVRVGPIDVVGQCEVQMPVTRGVKRCAIDIHFP